MKRSPIQRKLNRPGFTLVELLVVIAIIGVLVGLLVVSIGPIMRRTSEFAIQNEMQLIGASVEQFHNDFGFYPPSFDNPDTTAIDEGISNAGELLVFLNRIAPQHAEGTGATGTPIRVWFDTVGAQIGRTPGADLVFWLSGVLKNKQFPLTGGVLNAGGSASDLPVPYNHDAQLDGDRFTVDVEREVYFEFQLGRLIPDASGAALPPAAGYEQPRGASGVVFQYRDSSHYWFDQNGNGTMEPGEALAYYDGTVLADFNNGNRTFEELFPNGNTFQIATFGVDGDPVTATNTAPLDWRRLDAFSRDNVTNFSDGRLEKLLTQ